MVRGLTHARHHQYCGRTNNRLIRNFVQCVIKIAGEPTRLTRTFDDVVPADASGGENR